MSALACSRQLRISSGLTLIRMRSALLLTMRLFRYQSRLKEVTVKVPALRVLAYGFCAARVLSNIAVRPPHWLK